MGDRSPPPPATLAALGLAGATLERFDSGWINVSWLASLPGRQPRVLQRVNAIFPPGINDDIDVVTRHLEAKGLVTPRLLPLPQGERWQRIEGAVWRTLSYVPGVTYERLQGAAQAREAGRLLGRFHAALADLEHAFANARLGVHDTAKHLEYLERTLVEHEAHADYEAVRAVAGEILKLAAAVPALPQTKDRIVHGDPKISNVIFDAQSGKAVCLVDLDTLARMPVQLELGDALRSWCNLEGEDAPQARLDLDVYRAALAGYAAPARAFIAEPEWRAIPAGLLTIAVELAARFCADALQERYFAWNEARYGSASEHNLARAAAQLALSSSIREQWTAILAATEVAFSR
jgi:Ser/Thr protein kinase RdoA (MazF antagonist)